jgi:BNR repeat-containing family member
MRPRSTALGLAVLGALAVPASPAAPARAADADVVGRGAWSWFGDPRAVHYRGRHHRTYAGWVDWQGNVVVASWGPGHSARAVVARPGRVNDHSNPSLLVRRDRRLMVFYSGHDGPRMHYRVSTNPEDISSWGPDRYLGTNTRGERGYTYPNPIALGGEIHLFWRGGGWRPSLSRLAGGQLWSPARSLIYGEGQRPYVKYARAGPDTVYMAFSSAHPREGRASLYFAAFRRGSLFRASGARIAASGTLPIKSGRVDRIHDARRTDRDAWVHDIAVGASGRPVIVYTVFPTTGHHQYRYARWNGRRWEKHVIVRNAGSSISTAYKERHYSGGLTLDHSDPSVAYLSRKVGRSYRIERWRTRDGGRTWLHAPIATTLATGSIRPFSPRGLHRGEREVLWLRGSYGHFRSFRTWVVRLAPWMDKSSVR